MAGSLNETPSTIDTPFSLLLSTLDFRLELGTVNYRLNSIPGSPLINCPFDLHFLWNLGSICFVSKRSFLLPQIASVI